MVRTKELDQEYLAFSVQFYQFGKLNIFPWAKLETMEEDWEQYID